MLAYHANEHQRLVTLDDLGVMDGLRSECLDRITRTACALFTVPTAMID